MKRLQRKISVKADFMRKSSLVTDGNSTSFNEVALTEAASRPAVDPTRHTGQLEASPKLQARKVSKGLQRAQTVSYGPGGKAQRVSSLPDNLVRDLRPVKPMCGICYGEFSEVSTLGQPRDLTAPPAEAAAVRPQLLPPLPR
jgi:hypothetical protein